MSLAEAHWVVSPMDMMMGHPRVIVLRTGHVNRFMPEFPPVCVECHKLADDAAYLKAVDAARQHSVPLHVYNQEVE